MKKITIELSDETLDKITTFVNYENMKNDVINHNKILLTRENFIEGVVCKAIDTFEKIGAINSLEGRLQNNFKEILTEKEWSLKKLSKLTNIDSGTLSNILSNKRQPSIDNFLNIWQAFGYPDIESLFYRK